jgi:hypothetical protein
VMRIERRQAEGVDATMRARGNARSAVELALRVVANTPAWRTSYPHGVESTRQSLGTYGRGTVSWLITDTDGNLSNRDGALTLHGIGRVGEAVHVSSINVQAASSGPFLLRNYENVLNILNQKSETVEDDEYYGQYFKPTLPASAIGWRVTSVQLYCNRNTSNTTLRVRLYVPNGANMPSSTVIDSVDVNSNTISTVTGWQTFAFTGQTSLDPAEGVCLALETTSTQPPIEFYYYDGGVAESNSAFVAGTPGWNTYSTSRALAYRVYGVYVTAENELVPIAGTWQRQASPDAPVTALPVN